MSEPTSNMYFHNMSYDLLNKILFKPNLQGVITPKKKKIASFFFYFHQIIFSSSSTNWPCLKLLAILIFERS